MIEFAHIAPTNYTELGIHESDMNMVLCHIAEAHPHYAQMFRDSEKQTLLDNGAFENGIPYETERMLDIGESVGADIMVLPDYPGQPWEKGWEKVEEDIAEYKTHGFQTMFVPQSILGDTVGYLKSLDKAIKHPNIDLIGLSILGCPTAFNTLPKYKVREQILEYVEQNYTQAHTDKRFHILGMLDAADEVTRLTYYKDMINSWDSSAAIWGGINGIKLEDETKKFELAVDFDHPIGDFSVSLVLDNINYIKGLR